MRRSVISVQGVFTYFHFKKINKTSFDQGCPNFCIQLYVPYNHMKLHQEGTFFQSKLELTLLTGIGLCGHFHVVGWKKPRDPIELSFPPIRVVLVEDVDQLTFQEAHLVLAGCFVVIHGDDLTH